MIERIGGSPIKPALIVAASFLLGGGLAYTAYDLRAENSTLRAQQATAERMRAQLLEQTELNTRQRLEFETQIGLLQEQLLSSSSRLSSLSSALSEARDRIDPDYTELVEQARQEVAQQTAQEPRSPGGGGLAGFSDPATARIRAAENTPNIYGEYLDSLGVNAAERQAIQDAMVESGAARYQLLGVLLAGNLSAEQAATVFGANGLANGLTDVLSQQQLNDLTLYDLLVRQDTVRQVYGSNLAKTGGAINGITQDQVLDVLVDELFSEQNNLGAIVADDGSMITAYNDQLAAYDRARERLADELNAEQMSQLDRFIESQSSGVDVILEANRDPSGRMAIRNARIGLDNLPQ